MKNRTKRVLWVAGAALLTVAVVLTIFLKAYNDGLRRGRLEALQSGLPIHRLMRDEGAERALSISRWTNGVTYNQVRDPDGWWDGYREASEVPISQELSKLEPHAEVVLDELEVQLDETREVWPIPEDMKINR